MRDEWDIGSSGFVPPRSRQWTAEYEVAPVDCLRPGSRDSPKASLARVLERSATVTLSPE